MEETFDIVVNREQFISRILSPVSKFSQKAVLMLEGNRIYALANLTSSTTGQMYMLSDILMGNTIGERVEMVIGNVPKMITALKAIKTETILIVYDKTGLEYTSSDVSFRIRLSTESVSIPFKKERLLSLDTLAEFDIPNERLKEYSMLLGGFPNLNQMTVKKVDDSVYFVNSDRDGVTDEKLKYSVGCSSFKGSVPDNFTIYNYIFRTAMLTSVGFITMKIGKSFSMICSKNPSQTNDGGEIRYIIPKINGRG